MIKTFFSESIEDTKNIAKSLIGLCAANSVVFLRGELGSGKTTFVKGVAEFFDILDDITSPSFNIFYIYNGRVNLIHMDAYRLHSAADFENLMVDDFLIKPFVLIIEWPDVVINALPSPRLSVEIIDIENDKRKIVAEFHE